MLGTESARIIVCFHADIDIFDDRYERTWEEVVQNAATLSKKVSVSTRLPLMYFPPMFCRQGLRQPYGSAIAQFLRAADQLTVQAEDANVKRHADRCAESQANWSALQSELGALDGTLKTVAALRADMEGMCAGLKVLDEALDAHIQAKEERDMYKWKASIEQTTAEFEAGRQIDLAQMEKNLKAEKLRQEKLKKAEEDRILREIEARERREAALAAEAERKEKVCRELLFSQHALAVVNALPPTCQAPL